MGETKTTTATARFAFFFWRVQVCGCHKRGVSTDLREIPLDYRGYYDLEARGIIGGERRLDWIESITDAAAVVRVPTFLYSFDAQRPYQASFPLDSGKFQIFATNVTLTLGLLHEGDLPALLNELDRSAAGQFSVSNCDMARTGEQVLADPRHNNVDAVCHLQWFTIKKPDDDEESRS